MASNVYFVRANRTETAKAIAGKALSLFRKADLGTAIGKNDLVAVKIHFGEGKNDTHISPEYAKPVIGEIRKLGGNPFWTETCVLYKSDRDNAVNHLRLAREHGFTIDKTGAPVVIADGLVGSEEREVPIPGKIFDKVSIAGAAVEANAMVVLTHVTGHMATGIGGAIKNIGMGLASRKGKLRQHSAMKPTISEKQCTACEVCIRWCPEDAIAMKGKAAWINPEACIGCGECITVCRFDAVKHDWGAEEGELQRKMAEHALGVVIGKPGKVAYMNFVMGVTKDCDCMGFKQKPVLEDIGILAGTDPVAMDAASLDLIERHAGKTLTDLSYPGLDPWEQIRHGETIGLGSRKYQMIETP